MDTIRSYIETMFRELPQTPEVLRMKEQLLEHMEEKYNELKAEGKPEHEVIGIVLSEFGDIQEIKQALGIDEEDVYEEVDDYPVLSAEDAEDYIDIRQRLLGKVALGVSLIMVGVICLIILADRDEPMTITDASSAILASDGLPVVVLLLFAAVAVGLFIHAGTRLDRYKFIEKGDFHLDSFAKGMMEDQLQETESAKTTSIIIGVVLCVLSPMILILLTTSYDNLDSIAVGILLAMVSVAVNFFIIGTARYESIKRLLKKGDYNPVKKEESRVIAAIAGFVWPIAVAVFLITGFLFGMWHINWLIFPVVGLFFSAISAFYSAMHSGKNR